MGREWKEARDARVAEMARRRARGIFGQELQQLAIMDIKAKMMMAVTTLASPSASKIDRIKAARGLWQVVGQIEQLPEPTIENTWHPNSHRLIKVRDEFFAGCGLGWPRQRFIRAGFNLLIMIYDYDRPYRDIMDWAFQELRNLGWEPRGSQDLIAADWSSWWKE